MKIVTIIGLAIFLFTAIGLICYLIKLNYRAKVEQSLIDPEKLRKWDDD